MREPRLTIRPILPFCYSVAGLVCLLSVFTWRETVVLGAVHVGAFLIVQQAGTTDQKPVILFIGMIALGILIAAIAWSITRGPVYFPFPMAIAGNVAWAIVSWWIILSQSIKNADASGPFVRQSEKVVVLLTPMLLCGILGIIHAMTNSVLMRDRFADFLMVAVIGVTSGVFLALPLFCFPAKR